MISVTTHNGEVLLCSRLRRWTGGGSVAGRWGVGAGGGLGGLPPRPASRAEGTPGPAYRSVPWRAAVPAGGPLVEGPPPRARCAYAQWGAKNPRQCNLFLISQWLWIF